MKKIMETVAIMKIVNKSIEEEEDEGAIKLPGFRFHPTDEELVSFYLRRKVEKKRMEVIKQIDIYKYDPWDLPIASNVGEKEWYFFCMRGRKYRNSIRPNRVTGSGFWKATGIDKPIHEAKEPHDCIGLKKSLVYYRGNAGKGTKTDWMMHEFRLPPATTTTTTSKNNVKLAPHSKDIAQEAEIWTLCRIFKRIPSHRKYVPYPKQSTNINSIRNNTNNQMMTDSCSMTSSSFESKHSIEQYRMFGDSIRCPVPAIAGAGSAAAFFDARNSLFLAAGHFNSIIPHQQPPFLGSYYNHYPDFWDQDGADDQPGRRNDWDELRSVVERAIQD